MIDPVDRDLGIHLEEIDKEEELQREVNRRLQNIPQDEKIILMYDALNNEAFREVVASYLVNQVSSEELGDPLINLQVRSWAESILEEPIRQKIKKESLEDYL